MRSWRVEWFWLALVAVLLLLVVWWFPGTGSIATDSYSVGKPGKKVLFETLSQLEGGVHRSTEHLIPPGYGDRLLILGPARYPSADEWELLYDDVLSGGTLMFAANSDDPQAEFGPFSVTVVPLDDDDIADPAITADKDADKSADAGADATSADTSSYDDKMPTEPSDDAGSDAGTDDEDSPDTGIDRLIRALHGATLTAQTELVEGDVPWQTSGRLEFDQEQWEVLVTVEGKPQVIRRDLGDGEVMFVATDDPFSNAAMLDPDQALLAYRVLEAVPPFGETWVDETLNSSGVPQVLGILFSPAFRPITLQLGLIAVLFGWLGSRRFGPARRSVRERRRSIVEHAEALGTLYCRAGAGSHAVHALHEYLKLELRRLYGSGFRVESAEAVARQAQADPAEVRSLFDQLKSAPQSRLSTSQAGRLLHRLAELIAGVRKER